MKAPLAKTACAAALLAAASYAFFTLRGPHGVPALLEKQREIRDMEQKNAKLDRDIERLRDRVKRMEGNPSDQERAIRERLKLVKPGEKVYITGKPAQ